MRICTLAALVAAGSLTVSAEERMLPRTVERTTRLVTDGRTDALIVFPTVTDGEQLARTVQQAIASATGVKVAIAGDAELIAQIPAWPAEAVRRRPLILIGNINNNRALVPLYGNFLAAADLKYPGGDGYTVRTVVDPYGSGVNEIVLGASSTAGIVRAVARFAVIVGEQGKPGRLSLPGLLEVVPGGEYTDIVAEAGPSAFNWQWTGKPALLEKTVAGIRAAGYMKPETKFYNPRHYHKEERVRQLVAVIQSGALTDNEVNHLENILLAGLHEEYNAYWIVHDANWLGTRHQTMGMLAFLVTADYLFNRARPNEEAAAFLEKCVNEAHTYFSQFFDNYRDEGNDNTSFDSVGPVGRYMMGFGATQYFTGGAAQRAAQRALMVTDNRGWFIAAGNYEDVRQGRMNSSVDTRPSVCLPAFALRDGQLRWIIEHASGFNEMGGGWGFSSDIAGGRYPLGSDTQPTRPAGWLGVSTLPLSSYYYNLSGDYLTRGSKRSNRPWDKFIPVEQAVEMVTFRDRFDSDAQYLFLNGFQGGRYNSMDVNAILRFADRGHIWLVASTEQLGHYFRNALHVAGGYRDDYFSMPGTIRLDASANFDDAGMTATTLPHFNGADWTRHIFWQRGSYFAVIDTARFLEDSDYDLTCTWSSLPIARLEDGVWVSRFLDSRFELHNADGVEQRSRQIRAEATEQLSVYTYLLRQHAAVTGRTGEHFNFRNLFFTLPRDAPARYRVKPLGTDAMLISDGKDHLAVAGVCLGDETEIGPLRTNARMFLISTDSVRLTPPDAELRLDGKPLRPDRDNAAVGTALRALWRAAAAVRPAEPPLEPEPPAGASVVWTFADFDETHEEIGGVNVIHPPAISPPDELFDRQSLKGKRDYEWPEGTETVTYDLGRVETIAEMHLEKHLDIGYDKDDRRTPYWRKTGMGPLTVGFSNDNFTADVRERVLNFDHVFRHDPPAIYKPYSFAVQHWKQFPATGDQPLGIGARYVRTPAFRCNETTFFRAKLQPAAFDRLYAVDLDGDEHDELAAATAARQLVVLSADGTVRWSRLFDNRITDLYAADINNDGRNELLVADTGWYIGAYDSSGERVWLADCKQVGAKGAYRLGTVVPEGADRPYVVASSGFGANCYGPDGQIHTRTAGGGIVSDVVLRGTTSAPRAAHRSAVRRAWGTGAWCDVQLVDGGPRTAAAGGGLSGYWWLGLGMEYWPETNAPPGSEWHDGLAVAVARAGVDAYAMGDKKPSTRWRLPANGPLSAYAFVDMDGNAGVELVLGRLDGFIHVVDRNGNVTQTWSTGGPVHGLAAWGAGGAVIAAAMGDTVRFYDRDGKRRGGLDVTADHLATLRAGADVTLIAAGGGRVTAIQRVGGGQGR